MFKLVSSRFRRGGLRELLARLHRDERGAEAVEKLLILAAIALPLLGVLIIFRDRISEWVEAKWADIAGKTAQPEPDLPIPEL